MLFETLKKGTKSWKEAETRGKIKEKGRKQKGRERDEDEDLPPFVSTNGPHDTNLYWDSNNTHTKILCKSVCVFLYSREKGRSQQKKSHCSLFSCSLVFSLFTFLGFVCERVDTKQPPRQVMIDT